MGFMTWYTFSWIGLLILCSAGAYLLGRLDEQKLWMNRFKRMRNDRNKNTDRR